MHHPYRLDLTLWWFSGCAGDIPGTTRQKGWGTLLARLRVLFWHRLQHWAEQHCIRAYDHLVDKETR